MRKRRRRRRRRMRRRRRRNKIFWLSGDFKADIVTKSQVLANKYTRVKAMKAREECHAVSVNFVAQGGSYLLG